MASNGESRGVKRSSKSRYAKFGADGVLHLPPIEKPKLDDPYANSKLLTFRLGKQKRAQLREIILNIAMQVYNKTKAYNSSQPPSEPEPSYPEQMMSKDRSIKLTYQFFKHCMEGVPIAPIQPEWLENIRRRLPEHLKQGTTLQQVIKELFEEVCEEFDKSMRHVTVENALVRPSVKGLEEDGNANEILLPSETLVFDYATPWHAAFVANRDKMEYNLHVVHPTMQNMLNISQAMLGQFVILDFAAARVKTPIEFNYLRSFINMECDKMEEKLMNSWFPAIVNLFNDKANVGGGVRNAKLDGFYSCVTTAMSNQLKEVLIRSINTWMKLFDDTESYNLPVLRVVLSLEDDQMQFYPSYEDIEAVMISIWFNVNCPRP